MKKYLVLLILIVGCGTSQKKEPVQTVHSFLNWYEINYQTANDFALVNQDSTENYSVNFEETEKFLANLKTSGFVTENYLHAFRKQFIEAQRFFDDQPVNEGPPPHFDYDIVLYTQEPEWVFENKANLKILSSDIQDDKAVLNIEVGMKYQVILMLQEEKWLIERFSPLE